MGVPEGPGPLRSNHGNVLFPIFPLSLSFTFTFFKKFFQIVLSKQHKFLSSFGWLCGGGGVVQGGSGAVLLSMSVLVGQNKFLKIFLFEDFF